MKYILFISILFSVSVGCSDEVHNGRPVIVYKERLTGNSCWECDFHFIGLGLDGIQLFYDSCNKYNIGDTIKSIP